MRTHRRGGAELDVDLNVDELAALWSDGGDEDDEIDRLIEGDSRSRFATGTGTFDLRGEERAATGSEVTIADPVRPEVALSAIMTRKVVCARPEMDASEARRRMLERGVSGLPVVDMWGRAIGVVSKTDLVEREVTAEGGRFLVSDVMSPLVFALSPEASIARAAALMAYEGVHRVLVVDSSGHLLGVVSSLDVARWVGSEAGLPVGRTR